jgi:hypothetical protein
MMVCATYHRGAAVSDCRGSETEDHQRAERRRGPLRKLRPDRECQKTRRVAYRTETDRHNDGCRRRESQVLKEQKEDEQIS